MTDMLSINAATPTGSSTVLPLSVGRVPGASNESSIPRNMPAFIRGDEAYYWSIKWQADVRESMAALAAGDYLEFASDDSSDVVRWMLAVDDNIEA